MSNDSALHPGAQKWDFSLEDHRIRFATALRTENPERYQRFLTHKQHVAKSLGVGAYDPVAWRRAVKEFPLELDLRMEEVAADFEKRVSRGDGTVLRQIAAERVARRTDERTKPAPADDDQPKLTDPERIFTKCEFKEIRAAKPEDIPWIESHLNVHVEPAEVASGVWSLLVRLRGRDQQVVKEMLDKLSASQSENRMALDGTASVEHAETFVRRIGVPETVTS